MLTDADLIVFSDDWGRHPFSCMHLMKKFLAHNRILWVNTIGMRHPRLTLYDLNRACGKVRGWVVGEREANCALPENLTVIAPLMIPYNNVPFIRRWNCHSVLSQTRATMQRLGFRNPVLVITVPNATDYVGYLDEEIAAYYCVDEFAEWPGVANKLVADMEGSLLRKVDLVVAVSDELLQHKRSPLGPTRLLTHGVDIQHFGRVSSSGSRRPIPFFDAISGPVIGYFGLFDERSDQALLERLLQAHPDWSLVVLGRSVVDLGGLARYENFHHHGPVPYDNLPEWAARFDVCIIPYVMNKLTASINPLKLKEYLATGRPIVSTAIPEAVKFDTWIGIGKDAGDFIAKVEAALARGAAPAGQLEAVVGEDWQDKAEQFSGWIEESQARRRALGAVES